MSEPRLAFLVTLLALVVAILVVGGVLAIWTIRTLDGLRAVLP